MAVFDKPGSDHELLTDAVAAQAEPEAETKLVTLRVTAGADNFDTYLPGPDAEDGSPTELRLRVTPSGVPVESKAANKIIKSALSVGVTIEKGEI